MFGKKAKRILSLVMVTVMAFLCLCRAKDAVFAAKTSTEQKIEEQNEKIDDLKEQQEAAEEEIEKLEEAKSEMDQELQELNGELSDISQSIETLSNQVLVKEAEIAAKQEEIDRAQRELEDSVATQERQYEDMKTRIRFMYEYSQGSVYLSLLSTGLSNFLSKSEYIKDIAAYDRRMLDEYKVVTAEVKEKKAALEAEQAEMYTALEELKELESKTNEEKDKVAASIEETKGEIEESKANIDDAEAIAAAIEEQLAAAIAYEEDLERQKAAEDAARIAAIKAAEEANKTKQAVVVDSSSEAELLSALIYCEAGGEPYEGMLAVGCVVMNRVRSSSFPNSVSGVIYQSGQFTPVASGRLATVLANGLTTDACRSAAASVLAGNLPYPDFLYFRSARVSLPGVNVTWVGNQQFF